jgi:C-terminal processing protease CtpA/Prc
MIWNHVVNFWIAAILSGGVSQTDEPGRVGLTWNAFTHSVIRVYKDGPADRVGIRRGDKITSLLPEGPAGSLVTITLIRNGQELTFEVERVAVSALSKQSVDH